MVRMREVLAIFLVHFFVFQPFFAPISSGTEATFRSRSSKSLQNAHNDNNSALSSPESDENTYQREDSQIQPESNIPQVTPSVTSLNLTRPPTREEIMAAGQLGGQLYPTHEINDKKREEAINLSFGRAIQEWNKHKYKRAVTMFRKHMKKYPDSPWVSEAILHIGCDAHYNGRYTEAEESFQWILEENKYKDYEGAKILMNKAKLRLGVLKVDQNNLGEAKELFRELKQEGLNWRDRTYASHWIQRLSRYTSGKLSTLNCGTRALACLMEKDGKKTDAKKVVEVIPETTNGQSFLDLQDIASKYGYKLTALWIPVSRLKRLPLPAIMHIPAKDNGDSGHYWILEKIRKDTLELFDPQSENRFKQSVVEFSREWSGNALVFSDKKKLPGIKLTESDRESIYGGCCGVARPEDGLGDPDKGGKPPCGSPVWSVNVINMNLYVHDIPLWYSNNIGPSVSISLSYNSQSTIVNNEPFGNKWQFNYGSYLVIDTGGNVTIVMPDGRRDVYSPNGAGGYNHPYQVYNTLTKIAENYFELKFPDDIVYVYKIPSGTNSLQPFLVEIRDPYDKKITLGYNANVRLTTITDALGRMTTLTYNSQGLVTKVTDPFVRTALFKYDTNRNLIKITDMGGHASSLSYDKDVYLTRILNEKGQWDFYIEPSSSEPNDFDRYPSPGGTMWEDYRITITDISGGKAEYHYSGLDGYSWYVSPKYYIPYTDSKNNNTNAPKTVYNFRIIGLKQGEISKITDPEGVSVSYEYDITTGDRTKIMDANGNATLIEYNEKGNITKVTDPLENSVRFSYDTHDNLISLVDPADNTYIYGYNAKDELINIIDPKNGTTTFTYNASGEVATLKDAKKQLTTFTYDSQGNLTSMNPPLGGVNSYTYDTIGRVISHTDPGTNTTQYTYDNLNHLTAVTYPDGFVKYYNRDCCVLSSVIDRNGTLVFEYDELKRLKTFTDVYGKNISYDYDKSGNLITLTYPDGKSVNYAYDKADRLIRVTDWLGNVTSYEYDSTGSLARTIYPDGSIIAHLYDAAYRLKSIRDFRADDTANAVFNYTLDKLGNRTGISSYQPVQETPASLNISYTYNADNQMLTAGTTGYDYDSNGNMILKTAGTTVSTYGWDYNNMLTQFISGGNTYDYKYDGLGNRIAKIKNSTETRYVVGPGGGLSSILAETNASGTITAYYVYGLGLISKITPAGKAYYYHYDGLGNTIAITDSTGNIVNQYAYDAFGRVISQTQTITNPFKYVGRFGVMDEGNGLLYMRARYYDPAIGRFINKDPIGFLGGLNLYAYVANDPVNWIDPLGLAEIGSRPLDFRWIPFNGYGRLRHDQIWYDDGTNSGFLRDNYIGPDEKYTRNDYSFCRDPNHYDDNLMKQAEKNVQRNWDMDWRLLNNNCQDYINAIRREYERLK